VSKAVRLGSTVLGGFLACSGCVPELTPPPQGATPSLSAEDKKQGVVWQERFEQGGIGALGWASPSKASPNEILKVFNLESEAGSSFLHARHDARPGEDPPPAVHFGRAWEEGELPLDEACGLSWRWRIRSHPTSDEDPWLDLGASLYVVVELPGILSGGRGFKLGWLQKPTESTERQLGIAQIALRTDPEVGAWRDEAVDLCALYREHYGEDPRDVSLLYVGVVTDADNTESVAEADYAELTIRRAREPG
jgi:hypothetical protein